MTEILYPELPKDLKLIADKLLKEKFLHTQLNQYLVLVVMHLIIIQLKKLLSLKVETIQKDL